MFPAMSRPQPACCDLQEAFVLHATLQEEVAGRIIDAFSLRPAQTKLTDNAGSRTFTAGDGKTTFLVQVRPAQRLGCK